MEEPLRLFCVILGWIQLDHGSDKFRPTATSHRPSARVRLLGSHCELRPTMQGLGACGRRTEVVRVQWIQTPPSRWAMHGSRIL